MGYRNRPPTSAEIQDGERRFAAFVRDLTAISRRHAVVLHVTGGVAIAYRPEEIEFARHVAYTDDPSSGDLWPITP